MKKWITVKQARAIVGTLGFPSKMPGTAFGIPTKHCKVGSILKAVHGSVCAGCYADEERPDTNYHYQSVRIAQERRFAGLSHPVWAEAFSFLLNRAHGFDTRRRVSRRIKRGGRGFHRWHDAGDLQGLRHLSNIVRVAELTPRIRHWLPTREAQVVAQYLKLHGEFPANLCVRVSATMVDGNAGHVMPTTSTVHDKSPPIGHECPAPRQGNSCGPCRACWSREVANTSYHLH
jgi:hypothetical protein